MGINIHNIRIAIHYSLPFSVNDYYQQVGRIGRDRLPSDAYLLNDVRESTRWIDFIDQKQLEKVLDEHKKEELKSILEEEKKDFTDYVNSPDKWKYILDYFGDTLKLSIWE